MSLIGEEGCNEMSLPCGEKRTITWLAPKLMKGGGGYRNIIRMCTFLAKFGHTVRLHVGSSDEYGSSREAADLLSRQFWPVDYEIVCGYESIAPCDALVATTWKTAYVVVQNQHCCKKFYFVQDFENLFYPVGTLHLLAEWSYRLGLSHITSGPWLADVLREKYGAQADAVGFPLDRDVYHQRSVDRAGKRSVAFFAKPEMPRRCYELGLAALALFHQQRPDVEIILFGSQKMNSHEIEFPHKKLRLLPNLHSLAQLYSRVDVGMAFSTTNPSLVPFEMMACGCPVLDLDLPANTMMYGSRDNALFVVPMPSSIANGLCLLIDDVNLRTQIAKSGMDFVSSFPTEEKVARQLESIILKGVAQNDKQPGERGVGSKGFVDERLLGDLKSLGLGLPARKRYTGLKSMVANIWPCRMVRWLARALRRKF